ncbi:MAG: nucleotidyltransferase [Candidatus Omnitrophica bacterium]|nr:nucleotidyltransferase [Candidatus Omnitrophota bacterium]
MSRLENAIVEVARFLAQHRVPYMVIGGVANAVWGVPRATLDVDLTVWTGENDLAGLVGQAATAFRSREKDPLTHVRSTRVLPLETKEGIRIDMIFGQLPYEETAIQRAASCLIQGMEVRVCRPEDLILHKIISEREKDRNDVHGIIQQQGASLDRKYLDPKIAELTQGFDRPDIQAWYAQCLREIESG